VTDGENGCLYDPDQDNGLIMATRRLLMQQEGRQKMRTAAREEAERWGWGAATAQLRGYYQQVVGRGWCPLPSPLERC